MPKLTPLVWRTEKRRVNDLLPYEKNPRKITDKQMEDLKESLKKFNLAELPAINTDGKIVAGHQRFKALQLMGRGEEQIEIRIPNRKLTPSEFKQYLLTSNRSGGSWDWEILASDFDIDTLLTAGFDSTDLTNIFDDNLEVTDDNFDQEKELKKIKETDIKTSAFHGIRLGRHVDVAIAVQKNDDGTFSIIDGMHRAAQAAISEDKNILAFVEDGDGPTLRDIFYSVKKT